MTALVTRLTIAAIFAVAAFAALDTLGPLTDTLGQLLSTVGR